jgi:outer membrane protein OmpA-like peptidoglycan-associated protein
MSARRDRTFIVGTSVLLAGMAACGGERQTPRSLVDARNDVQSARTGMAVQLAPAQVRSAQLALQRAEMAYADEPDDPSTNDLALIADRKALTAQSEATALYAQMQTQQARTQLRGQQQQDLQTTRGQLSRAQMQLQDMETNLKEARESIARIAAVKDDQRGMVVTLQSELLFKTGRSDLKPAATAKLDEIARALQGKQQPLVVYGHTDGVGSHDSNMELSDRRAQTVRDYLVRKGIPQELITAQGKGPEDPVADNASVEGRAQNRRVEIVVRPKR